MKDGAAGMHHHDEPDESPTAENQLGVRDRRSSFAPAGVPSKVDVVSMLRQLSAVLAGSTVVGSNVRLLVSERGFGDVVLCSPFGLRVLELAGLDILPHLGRYQGAGVPQAS